MADALLKISDTTKTADACKSADDDGLLVTTLLEALTATNRLNVGAHGRTTYTPSNYSTAGQSLDEHLTGIDSVLAGVGAAHALGGGQHSADSLANLNAKVTGGDLDFDSASRPPSGSATGDLTSSYPNPQVAKIRGYAVQAHAPLDGEVLQWVSANSQYEPTAAGAPGAHLLGGTSHTADSLGNLNAKVIGGSLDFATAQRTAVIHNLGSNLRHGSDTLANLNALVTGGDLDFDSASRPPSGAAGGALSGTYPNPDLGYDIVSSSIEYVCENTSWEDITGMSITPVEGTYLVWFNTHVGRTGEDTNYCVIGLFIDTTLDADSLRATDLALGTYHSMGTQGVLTVNGSQAIKARARVGHADTDFEIYDRSLMILRVTD